MPVPQHAATSMLATTSSGVSDRANRIVDPNTEAAEAKRLSTSRWLISELTTARIFPGCGF